MFGHTHYGWSTSLDGTRFLQACCSVEVWTRMREFTLAGGHVKRLPNSREKESGMSRAEYVNDVSEQSISTRAFSLL